MRISSMLQLSLAAALVAAPAYAQKGKAAKAAPAAGPMVSAPAALAGTWTGTFTNDVTSKGGKLVLTLTGSDESASGQLQLTPMGGKTVVAEGSAPIAAPAKGKAAAAPSGGLSVTAMKSDEKVSGSIDGSYWDPGCNCSVVSTFEGELQGNTITGTISARDARTGAWSFSSFTATKGGAAKR
jgi:hypothetical protein